MSAGDTKTAIRRFFAILNEQRLDDAADMLAVDYRLHFDGNAEMDRQAGLGFFGAFFAAFPDIRHEIQDEFAEGDRVAARIVVRGTQRAELMGIPATGKPIAIGAINIFRFENGLIAEQWVSSDSLGMMQQLGVIPGPAHQAAA
jgi:steroid delta-isomerase-like uncharacterized protein